jgi:hypothetical protein
VSSSALCRVLPLLSPRSLTATPFCLATGFIRRATGVARLIGKRGLAEVLLATGLSDRLGPATNPGRQHEGGALASRYTAHYAEYDGLLAQELDLETCMARYTDVFADTLRNDNRWGCYRPSATNFRTKSEPRSSSSVR